MRKVKGIFIFVLSLSIFMLLIPSGAMAEEKTENTQGYSDIQNVWAKSSINKYGYSDIFDGGDGQFHPETAVTRMEFARMLHRALGINIRYFCAPDVGTYFNDVKNSDEGAEELYDLVSCGIVDLKGSFHPNDTLSRDEMTHYIMKAVTYIMGENDCTSDKVLSPYLDDGTIASKYRDDVYKATSLGFVGGRGNNAFCPKEAATRSEAVTVARRLAMENETRDFKVSVRATAEEKSGELLLTLSVINNTENEAVITYANGQKFDFILLDIEGNELYRWSRGMAFIDIYGAKLKIAAHDESTFSATVDSATFASIKSKLYSVKAYITGASDNFKIDGNGYVARVTLK